MSAPPSPHLAHMKNCIMFVKTEATIQSGLDNIQSAPVSKGVKEVDMASEGAEEFDIKNVQPAPASKEVEEFNINDMLCRVTAQCQKLKREWIAAQYAFPVMLSNLMIKLSQTWAQAGSHPGTRSLGHHTPCSGKNFKNMS